MFLESFVAFVWLSSSFFVLKVELVSVDWLCCFVGV